MTPAALVQAAATASIAASTARSPQARARLWMRAYAFAALAATAEPSEATDVLLALVGGHLTGWGDA